MKNLVVVAQWALILGGLVIAYEEFSGVNLVNQFFGTLATAVNVVVFGGAAVILAYHLLAGKKRR